MLDFLTTGSLSIKDSQNTVVWTNDGTRLTGTAPYYLLLANDGSLMQYDSTAKIVFQFSVYMQGLNNMVRAYYR